MHFQQKYVFTDAFMCFMHFARNVRTHSCTGVYVMYFNLSLFVVGVKGEAEYSSNGTNVFGFIKPKSIQLRVCG